MVAPCSSCVSGHEHDGTANGKETRLHSLDVYVSEPSNPAKSRGNVVIIPDGFGWTFVNTRILADHLAEKGQLTVYLPDFMQGHPCPIWMMDTMKSLTTRGDYLWKPYHLLWAIAGFVPFIWYNRIGPSAPIVRSFFRDVRASSPSAPIFAVGYCWGGCHLVNMAGDETKNGSPPWFDAAFTGHPSGIAVPADVEKMRVPVSFAIGDLDTWVPPASAEKVKEIVEQFPSSIRGELKMYKGCGHGFCVRADPTCDEVSAQATAAEDQCIAWFDKQLRERSYL